MIDHEHRRHKLFPERDLNPDKMNMLFKHKTLLYMYTHTLY